MKRLLALACIALTSAACTRAVTISYHYVKTGISDQQAIDDKQALKSVRGVTSVVAEQRGDRASIDVMVEEDHESDLIAKAEALGYTRIK